MPILEQTSVSCDLRRPKSEAARLAQLCDLTRALAYCASPREVFSTAAARIPGLMNCGRASIAIRAHDGDYLRVNALCGKIGSIPVGHELQLKDSIVGEAVQTRRLAAYTDLRPRNHADAVSLADMGFSGCMNAPLFVGADIVGTLNTATYAKIGYSDLDRHLLTHCAQILAMQLERVRTIDQMRSSVSALQRKDGERVYVLREFDHEIRTPLTALAGYAELLEQSHGLEPEVSRVAKAIHVGSRHVLEISRAILGKLGANKRSEPDDATTAPHHGPTSARCDLPTQSHPASQHPARPTPTRVPREITFFPALADDLRCISQPQLHSKGLSLEFARAPGIAGQLHGPRHLIARILVNLIDNAAKFSVQDKQRAHNVIEIRLEPSSQPTQEVIDSSSTEIEFVEIRVRDHGPGISPCELPGIFDYNTRGSMVDDSIPGSGLGLHLARAYARSLGGDLWCTTKLGEGSEFIVRLPGR